MQFRNQTLHALCKPDNFIVSLSYELEVPVCFVGTGEKIDELKAKEIADDFLKKYIKIDPDVNRYLLEGFQISVESLTLGTFTVSYVKCIEGLPTDEVLTVCVSEYGQICSYDGRNIRQYINNDHIISKEKISYFLE